MRLLVLLLAVGLIDARPQALSGGKVVGGENAAPGEFPWQLSQQRQGTATWTHSCGAVLLSDTRALSAGNCVVGAAANILRVIAGLHVRSDTSNTVTAMISRYVVHEEYDSVDATLANDIAILHFATISANGGTIQFARLPTNDLNNFGGTTCVITGWGRTGSAATLPDTLQKASIPAITPLECRRQFVGLSSTVWDKQICAYDVDGLVGSCLSDNGGPMSCPGAGGTTVVVGVHSWVITILNACQQGRPSVFTRTSSYLAWINAN